MKQPSYILAGERRSRSTPGKNLTSPKEIIYTGALVILGASPPYLITRPKIRGLYRFAASLYLYRNNTCLCRAIKKSANILLGDNGYFGHFRSALFSIPRSSVFGVCDSAEIIGRDWRRPSVIRRYHEQRKHRVKPVPSAKGIYCAGVGPTWEHPPRRVRPVRLSRALHYRPRRVALTDSTTVRAPGEGATCSFL